MLRSVYKFTVSSRAIPSRMVSQFTNDKKEPDLYHQPVEVTTNQGKTAKINLVYQDTKPEGSQVGTVVAVHGAPGSHKDFKYVTPYLTEKGVRVIGVNWPGQGYSSYDENLRDTNDERVQMVQHLIDDLNLKKDVVFMGHSRGSENALKMGALNEDKSAGIVLINPICLSAHRGVQPFPFIRFLGWVWKTFIFMRFFFNPFLHVLYNKMFNLRTVDGHAAGVCLHLMNYVDFEGQIKYINMVNKQSQKVITCFAGKDFLIQPSLSKELAGKFENNIEMVCSTKEEDPELEEEMKKHFDSGHKHLSAYFKQDGHFLQKTRAEFLANSALNMLRTNTKNLEAH